MSGLSGVTGAQVTSFSAVETTVDAASDGNGGIDWLDLTGESADDAHISPMDRGLAYGDGLFATMRVNQSGRIDWLETHLSRLNQGAVRLGFSLNIDAIRLRLVAAGAAHSGKGLKLLISRGAGGRGYAPPLARRPLAILSAFSLPAHYLDWQQNGIALAITDIQLGRQPRLAGIKHLNRLEQVLIRSQPLPDGADDWLVCDSDGELIEASMANLLIIIGNTCYTPAHAHAGVSGVMRQHVIEALLSLGLRVEATALKPALLEQAQSVLMTNCLMGVVEVRRIAHHHFGPFHALARLREILDLML